MERVSTIIGNVPVILVAPHGPDDTLTATITEGAAKSTGAYAVINRGFERSKIVNTVKDKADCNKISHCNDPVVYDEFLKPILGFVNRIQQVPTNKSVPNVYIFYIHGCSDAVHAVAKQTASKEVSVILGYGLGIKKDSLTMDSWLRCCFAEAYRNAIKQFHQGPPTDVFDGQAGGSYTGRDSDNLNQYYRKHDPNPDVQTLQLEIPFKHRNPLTNVSNTTEMVLSMAISGFLMKIKTANAQGTVSSVLYI